MLKKKILVTGVAGFVGSNLADRLVREGYSVIGIDNLSQGFIEQVPKEVEFHKLDVRSKDKIAPLFTGIDVVFHLAAKTNVSECQEAPYETADINVMGTLSVFGFASWEKDQYERSVRHSLDEECAGVIALRR